MPNLPDMICPDCDGSGEYADNKFGCARCRATGRVQAVTVADLWFGVLLPPAA